MTDQATTEGLRERNRRQTEQRLQHATLTLFAAKGYDATSIDEIAVAAGIGRRTFFRYFSTKEDLLFSGDEGFTLIVTRSELEAAIRHSDMDDPQVSDLAAMARVLTALAPVLEAKREHLAAFNAALASSAALRGRSFESREYFRQWLSRALQSHRHLAPAQSDVLAGVGMALHYSAVNRWLKLSPRSSLARELTKEFEIVERSITAPGHRNGTSRKTASATRSGRR